MALLLIGKTICPLCGKVIVKAESAMAFGAFVANEADPCFMFSDQAFHTECVRNSADGKIAIERFEEWQSKVGPGKRKCTVCNLEVTDPDNYLFIGGLGGNPVDPLHKFDYTHLHKSCVPKWPLRKDFIADAEQSVHSGVWRGNYLSRLLKQVKELSVPSS